MITKLGGSLKWSHIEVFKGPKTLQKYHRLVNFVFIAVASRQGTEAELD